MDEGYVAELVDAVMGIESQLEELNTHLENIDRRLHEQE